MPRSSKGSQFERDLCHLLSKWWTSGVRDDIFWRTSQSGGRATTRKKKGQGTYGQENDICAIDPIGRKFLECFTIEAKRGYNKEHITNLLDHGSLRPGKYQEWIEKLQGAVEDTISLFWMLIHKKDKRQTMVYFPKEFADEYKHMTGEDADANYIQHMNIYITDVVRLQDTIVQAMLLDDWLELYKPEGVIEIVRKLD